jgi:hypothetical protein
MVLGKGCRTPIWLKTDPRLAEGTGDKLLLRQLAKELGLSEAAGLKKRAIHFGENIPRPLSTRTDL